MRRFLVFFTMLMLCGILASAQTRTVTGKVFDKDGSPVPFASVKVKGGKTGTQADANGAYSIKAQEGDVFEISAAGFKSTDVTVGNQSLIVSTIEKKGDLQEVVVTTALNIKRKADNLSYAVQGLKADKLSSTRQTDINTALAGKIAGVQVLTETEAKLGSSSKIRLRGVAGLADPSAIFVVDGTIMSDISSLNMDDVEDVQVLKGPSAIAVYGQRAEAGVVMITSKKARKRSGLGVEINSTTTFTSVGRLPKYQNEYAGGTPVSAGKEWVQFNWAEGMPEFWKPLDGKYYHTYNDDASWGPKMAGQEYIPWYAWFPGTEYSFKTAKLTPQPNNIRDFWDKGINLVNNIVLSKATENTSIRFSYTNQSIKGIIPYSSLKKNNFSTQLNFDLNSKLSLGANINYVNDKVRGDFDDTYGNNSSGSFSSWFHRDLDMNILRDFTDYRNANGSIPTWNLNDAAGVSSDLLKGGLYWTNFYSYYKLAENIKYRNRLFGDINLTYKFNDHFKVQGFIRHNGFDSKTEGKLPYAIEISTTDGESPLSTNEFYGSATKSSTRPIRATYTQRLDQQRETNFELLASYTDKFLKDNLQFDFNAGLNVRKTVNSFTYISTKGGLVVPDLYAISNSLITPSVSVEDYAAKQVRSIYFRGSIGWKEFFILDFSGRKDWTSALRPGNNGYFYPSLGATFIFSKFLQDVKFLSFGKLRGSIGRIGQDLGAYEYGPITYGFGLQFNNTNATTSVPNTKSDLNIIPSLSTVYEAGIDLRFFSNRIGISATYYDDKRTDQIIPVPVSGTSGFTNLLKNAATTQRKGIELTLDITPIKSRKLQWDLTFNYAQNTMKVLKLNGLDDILYLGGSDYTSSAGNPSYAPGVWAIPGGEYGQLRGTGYKKNSEGTPYLDASGRYIPENNLNYGSILPKFTGGVTSTLKLFDNFTFNMSLDFAKGGKFYSLSNYWGKYSGLLQETAVMNDRGHSIREAVVDGGGVHVTGIDTATLKPIDHYLEATDYFRQYGQNTMMNESSFFDLDFLKIREISFGYKLPVNKMGKIGQKLQGANFSIMIRNPAILYSKNTDLDPSELVGSYGESGQLPPTRSVGVTLKLIF